MDPFETLPPELLVPVLRGLPDPESLYNISKASPGVFHFLNSALGAEVLDNILDSWCAVLLDNPLRRGGPGPGEGAFERRGRGILLWMPYILRLIALVRSCSLADQVESNLTAFILRYIMPSDSPTTGFACLGMVPPLGLPTIRLQDVTGGDQAISPRAMLYLIRKVLVLTDECFHFFHDGIKTTKPRHLAENFSWRNLHAIELWGKPYEIDDGGDVSWYEHQRILLGFCILQLRYELSNAVHEGRLDWSPDDIKNIRAMDTSEMYDSRVAKPHLCLYSEQVWAAAVYVASLEGRLHAGFSEGRGDFPRTAFNVFYDTGLQPLNESHLRLPRPKQVDPDLRWPATVIRQPRPYQNLWSQCYSLMFSHRGAQWAEVVFRHEEHSLTKGMTFRPFRRLGFGIWDSERLTGMEMIDDPYGAGAIAAIVRRSKRFRRYDPNQAFTWASLLSTKEKDELRAHQQARVQRAK